MKTKILIGALILSMAVLFTSCNHEPDEFELSEYYYHSKERPNQYWDNKNSSGEYVFYTYTIIRAPERYKHLLKTTVFYNYPGGSVGNMWKRSRLDEIDTELERYNIRFFDLDGKECISVTTLQND